MQERILKSYLFINFLLYSFSYDPGAIKDQDHICCHLEIPMGDVEGCLKLFSRHSLSQRIRDVCNSSLLSSLPNASTSALKRPRLCSRH
ncbi:hypothetical protein HZ326_23280 [Fusarium oxysporum f. sp. albedinis]|nr:hypothetical protein HZ326_23280 [Fusarium oxysporum f. sp. albedinis]